MGSLKAERLRRIANPGRYGDGGGLYLVVAPGGSKSWVQRIMVNGQRLDKGLGGLGAVSLSQARELADANRVVVKRGGNPWPGRDTETVKASRRAPGVPTFKELAIRVHSQRSVTRWQNRKNVVSWLKTFEKHVFPNMGDLPVNEITRRDILAVLEPIWTETPEIARRIRQRIKVVFDVAFAEEHVDGINPAGPALNAALDPMPRLATGHHKALPWRDVPAALSTIRHSDALPVTRMCFEFLILTAARSAEARGATWEEIDLQAGVWTIAADRMKSRRVHRVPLSTQAIVLLHEARRKLDRKAERDSGLVFPNASGKALSDNSISTRARKDGLGCRPHGFRSSFRDWAAEQSSASREAIELALAHVVGNSTETAYFRTDLLDQRRPLMESWANHCDPLLF